MERTAFREAVFARDIYTCVMCGDPGQDAHHIIERRLFPDGGYYLNNGATLCGACHLKAESTEISAVDIRERLSIPTILPPHLYPDEIYDKWGNVILPNGRRLKGELFDDVSVQKILAPVLHLFDNRVKYPRTWHLPWSANITSDDRVLDPAHLESWVGKEVVITEKMDGENTTLYRDYLHARSVDYSTHITRNWMKNFHASMCGDIPEGMRICGENLSFKHSIHYTSLPSFFMVFSIWEGSRCLSWDDTVEWCKLLNLHHVPVLYTGSWPERIWTRQPGNNFQHEGFVIRPRESFTLREFSSRVGKYVRKNHVTTHGHWMRSRLEPNRLQEDYQDYLSARHDEG